MANEEQKAFYRSMKWRKCRDAYMRMGQGLCEPCLKAGRYTKARYVHHKTHITPDNLHDPEITLSFDNLERVCPECHAKEHPEIYGEPIEQRVRFDAEGNVVRKDA